MRRFWGLLVNEHIKVLLKTSTIIMLILVALAAVGLNGLLYFSERQYLSQQQEDMAVEEEDKSGDPYKDQINYLQTDRPEGWETELEKVKYLQSSSIPFEDWRTQAVDDLYAAREEEDDVRAAQLEQFVTTNNFKGYMELKIADVKADETLSDPEREANLYALNFRRDNGIYSLDDWRMAALDRYISGAQTVAKYEKSAPTDKESKDELKTAREDMAVSKYRLENDIERSIGINASRDGRYDYWSVFRQSSSVLSFISVLIIVIAGSSIAGEFSQGTVKFLLINPIKRWKIFSAKYISVLTSSVIMVALFYVVNAICAGLFFGFGDLGLPYLAVSGDTVTEMSGFLYVGGLYLAGMVQMIVIGTMAFMLSSLVRSAALSIGIGVFALLGGGTVMAVLASMGMDWARYILFANIDLISIAEGNTMFPNQSLTFAIVVIAVYMVVFLLTAYDAFTRRDVK